MSKYLFLLSLLFVSSSFAAEGQVKETKVSWLKVGMAALNKLPAFVIQNQIPIEIHGKYCGPGHGDGTYRTEPIDEIDRACMRHDQCFDQNVGGRYLSCGCDFQLVADLLAVIASSEDFGYSTGLAGAIMAYFSKSECKCFQADGSHTLLESPNIFNKWFCEL